MWGYGIVALVVFWMCIPSDVFGISVTVHQTFSTEIPQGEALASTGTSFFSTDGTVIYEHDFNGVLLQSFMSPSADGQMLERGLAFDGSNLWVFNRYQFSGSSMFFKLDTSGNILASFPAPPGAQNMFGLSWDGSNLVGADFTGNQLLRIDTVGNLVSTVTTNAVTLGGLGFDGQDYVSFDFNAPAPPMNQALVQIDPASGMVVGRISRDPNDPNSLLIGHVFTYVGADTWLIREGFTSVSSTFHLVSFQFDEVTSPSGGNPVPTPSATGAGLFCFMLLRLLRPRIQ